jgi:ATP-binding cassette subfamily B protein
MGVIFQDFVRYNLSAADNIAVGRIAAREDRARVKRAALRSQADEVIAKLPAGYDQMIGRRHRRIRRCGFSAYQRRPSFP